MEKKLIIYGALANLGIDQSEELLFNFFQDNISGIEILKSSRGPNIKNALDFQALINIGADLASIASVIWMAYDKFIKPKKQEDKSKNEPFLYIQIKSGNDKFVQFAIGKEYKDKDIFINSFVDKTQQIIEIKCVEKDIHKEF